MLQGCSVSDRSSTFGAFAEALRILITDVNDNAPVFKPISEIFGEQLGLVHPVGSSCTHTCSITTPAVGTFPQPGQGCVRCRARPG